MKKNLKWIIFVLVAVFLTAYFIFVVASPIIFTQQTPQWLIDIFGKKIVFSSNSGNIGDTIGIMNPFVGIFAAVITFVAFWVQYKANDVLKKDTLKKDATDKFFEMLRMHNENVKELNFLCYLDEFASVFKTYRLINKNPLGETKEAIKSAYKIFFWGISNKECDEPERNILMNLANPVFSFADDMTKSKYEYWDYIQKNRTIFEVSEVTKEFIGQDDLYQGRKKTLVRYYRHLYLMVKFIAHNKNLDYSEKRELLRILRAQMSGEEQLMLFFNWASGIGIQWEEMQQSSSSNNRKIKYNHFFTEFRVIHNIIPEQLDFIWSDNTLSNAKEFVKLFKELCPSSSLPPKTPSDPEKLGIDTIFEFEDWEEENTYFNYKQECFFEPHSIRSTKHFSSLP
jgi:hypothetical protein